MGWQLWFKARYVEPILTGQKTRTARARKPLCRPGDQVVACVGPSRPFALLRILTCDLVPLSDIDADYRAGVEATYPAITNVWLVTFEMVESLAQQFTTKAQPRGRRHEQVP
jgi:hypothetical protein